MSDTNQQSLQILRYDMDEMLDVAEAEGLDGPRLINEVMAQISPDNRMITLEELRNRDVVREMFGFDWEHINQNMPQDWTAPFRQYSRQEYGYAPMRSPDDPVRPIEQAFKLEVMYRLLMRGDTYLDEFAEMIPDNALARTVMEHTIGILGPLEVSRVNTYLNNQHISYTLDRNIAADAFDAAVEIAEQQTPRAPSSRTDRQR